MIATVPLRQVATIYCGGTPSKAEPSYWHGDIPWVSPKDMGPDIVSDAEDHISAEAVSGSATRIVPERSILIVVRSGILVWRLPVAITSRPVAFNQDIKALVVDTARCLPEYIFWLLKSREGNALSHGVKKGATVHSLSAGYVESISVPMLPLDEQRRIVDILDQAASIRRLRHEAQAKVRKIIPALFVDMFGDPASNPKEWPVYALGDIIDRFEGGKNLQAGDDDGVGDKFRILKVSAITSGYFRSSESKPSPNNYMPPPNHFVRKGDLLFSRANTVDLVGATAYVYDQPDNILLPDKLWRFVWKNGSLVHPFYMLHFLQQGHTRTAMSRMATGTSDSMKNISQAKLLKLPTPVPPLTLQREFAERVAEIDALASLGDTATQGAERLAQSLMSQVFRTSNDMG